MTSSFTAPIRTLSRRHLRVVVEHATTLAIVKTIRSAYAGPEVSKLRQST